MIEIKPSLASNIIYPKIKDKLQEIIHFSNLKNQKFNKTNRKKKNEIKTQKPK